ncbi:hypothetical protein H1R20_g16159, partial [Candolleomyces eurysporus]
MRCSQTNSVVQSCVLAGVLLACASEALGIGIRPKQIKNLVTFGDSFTSVDWSSNGGTPWPVYAAGYSGVKLFPYAKAGATCSNNLTYRPFPPLFEGQLPLYFEEKANGTVKVAPQETVYTLWIGTNDLGTNALLTGNPGTKASLVEVTDCMVNWVKVLYQRGVRNFIFQNMIPLETIPLYAPVSYYTRYWTAERNSTEWSVFMRELVLSGNQLTKLKLQALAPTLRGAHIEPNYALHLEVAEYINSKKANNPREAAMSIARLANHRNPHVAILALALLDTLVQSCGYPFHLQISTKEFLNELVRRFPERPPPFPGPVMSRILELIHGWKEGICAESRWKEDLGNIRDMHRLLTFKGYRFREFNRSQPGAAATANLKTAEELEEEDRAAQSAKLQELIRRGTPRDLAAAQELMKSLAGANPDAKPDYRAQALTELNKLEQKVILLNEMLDNVDTTRGEKFVTGDAYDVRIF